MEITRSVLEPKAIYFFTPQQQDRKDWESCFYLKAAAVYSAITRTRADGGTAKVAQSLLLSIAKELAPLTTVLTTDKTQTAKAAGENSPVEEEDLGKLTESRMKTIDAVYLVVGVLHYLKEVLHDLKDKSGRSWDREKLDAEYATDRLQDAVADVVKMKNQIPLHLLAETVENLETATKKAVEAAKDGVPISSLKSFKLNFDGKSFLGVVHLFCWYFSPFYIKTRPTLDEKLRPIGENLLECLHSTLLNGFRADEGGRGRLMADPVPTAAQLARSGLGFKAASDGKLQVQFSDPNLQLPAMVFDFKLETVVMNLLEWERSHMERPVTRYFALLTELVQEDGDVRVLGRAGVLRGRWSKEGEVLGFLRSVQRFASYPSAYSPVDGEVKKVRASHKERMGRFMVRNRPAVVWGSSAALASLLVTVVLAVRRRRR